jgi:hypothetical protein
MSDQPYVRRQGEAWHLEGELAEIRRTIRDREVELATVQARREQHAPHDKARQGLERLRSIEARLVRMLDEARAAKTRHGVG